MLFSPQFYVRKHTTDPSVVTTDSENLYKVS